MLCAMTASDDSTLTSDDIAALNGQMVARSAAFARVAGTALVIAGVVAIAAWVWIAVRQQQALESCPAGAGGVSPAFDVSFSDRIDLLVSQILLGVTGVLAAGVGLGLRLIADYSVVRVGGSLTGFEPGDEV
jgi:hypothetical protein